MVSTSIDAKSGDSSPVKERTARFDIFSDQYQISDPKTLQKNILYTRPVTIKFTPPQFTNFYFAAGLPKPWMDEMAFRLNLGERGNPPITLHCPFYRNVQLEAGAERNWGKGVIAGGAVRHEDIHHPDDPANTGKEKGVTGFRTSLLARYALSESVRMYAGVGLIGINDDSVQLANPSTAPLRKYAGSFTVGRENWFTLAPWSVGGWQPYGAIVVNR